GEVVGNCGQLLVDSSVKSGIILSKSASTRPDPDPRLEHAQLPISEPAKTQCVGILSLSERAKGLSRDPSARRTIKEFRPGKVLSTGRIRLFPHARCRPLPTGATAGRTRSAATP